MMPIARSAAGRRARAQKRLHADEQQARRRDRREVVLATLFRGFTVERASPSTAVREAFAFTMYPVGLDVRVSERGE